MSVNPWIKAFRLRTLPLALSSIMMGSFLAAAQQSFSWVTALLCALTTVLLQILSNLSNDYGDSVHGADNVFREGPSRAVQSGAISLSQMKRALYITGALAFVTGVYLLYTISIHVGLNVLGIFLMLGILAIVAAIKYTAGKNPYGYRGLGDISVFIFFGLLGVLGTFYLQAFKITGELFLPAASCGFFSAAVLNVNNIRDIESDKIAGKISIPVRLGPEKARIYHWFLLLSGISCSIAYTLWQYKGPWQWLFLVSVPLILLNGIKVQQHREATALDPFLKQMAMATLLFVITFGTGLLLSV